MQKAFGALLEADPGAGRCYIKITVSGEITPATASALIKVIDVAADLDTGRSVVLDSPGGDMLAALQVARHIRAIENVYTVWIVTTDARCDSACVVLLAGGYQRLVYGSVGVHRPYFSSERVKELGYANLQALYDDLRPKLKDFFRSVNVDESIVDMMWRTPSHEIRTLAEEELAQTGLDRDDAVLVELQNAELRDRCGRDAPAHQADFNENVLYGCLNDHLLDSKCFQARARTHPYCSCWNDGGGKPAIKECAAAGE